MGKRNPAWSRDELILALDLFFRCNPLKHSQTSPEVIELSKILNQLSIHVSKPDEERFRNPNGVYMKLCNFLRLDPTYEGQGLKAGSKLEEVIWAEFAASPKRLNEIANSIKAHLATDNYEQAYDEDDEAPEGRILMNAHKSRERNQKLVNKKKNSVSVKACEVCGFVFLKKYGAHGDGYIECHHTIPLHLLEPGHKTRLKDLSLVCANCHRMLHRKTINGNLLSIQELRNAINVKG